MIRCAKSSSLPRARPRMTRAAAPATISANCICGSECDSTNRMPVARRGNIVGGPLRAKFRGGSASVISSSTLSCSRLIGFDGSCATSNGQPSSAVHCPARSTNAGSAGSIAVISPAGKASWAIAAVAANNPSLSSKSSSVLSLRKRATWR